MQDAGFTTAEWEHLIMSRFPLTRTPAQALMLALCMFRHDTVIELETRSESETVCSTIRKQAAQLVKA